MTEPTQLPRPILPTAIAILLAVLSVIVVLSMVVAADDYHMRWMGTFNKPTEFDKLIHTICQCTGWIIVFILWAALGIMIHVRALFTPAPPSPAPAVPDSLSRKSG